MKSLISYYLGEWAVDLCVQGAQDGRPGRFHAFSHQDDGILGMKEF